MSVKRIINLSLKERFDLLQKIQYLLYLDVDEKGEFWNPKKPLDSTTLGELDNAFTMLGLKPTRRSREP